MHGQIHTCIYPNTVHNMQCLILTITLTSNQLTKISSAMTGSVSVMFVPKTTFKTLPVSTQCNDQEANKVIFIAYILYMYVDRLRALVYRTDWWL